MKPSEPIIPGLNLPVTQIAKDQDAYLTLPAHVHDGTVLSRWHLSWRERLSVLVRGDVYLWVLTCGRPLQPVMLQTDRPHVIQELRPR